MFFKPTKYAFAILIAAFLLGGGGLGGWLKPDLPIAGSIVRMLFGGSGPDSTSPRAASASAGGAAGETLRIASFNIQVLGTSKMGKPEVVATLSEIIRQFDVVAIQEIRSKDPEIIPRLVKQVNAEGGNYKFVIGPRLGRTVSKEQYAYVFDANRVLYNPDSVGTVLDPSDVPHREPFFVQFLARTDQPEKAFSFWLVNIHTDPDEVPQELAALAQVYSIMKNTRFAEDDVILLGDFNAAASEMLPLGQVPGLQTVIANQPTNTRLTKSYDNLLFDQATVNEFTGSSGVYSIQDRHGMKLEQALEVSDHLPVWAEFSVWESGLGGGASGGRVATLPASSDASR